MKRREYYVRDQAIEVHEVEGAVAIRLPIDPTTGEPVAPRAYLGTRKALVDLAEVDQPTAESFETAGWVFVLPSPETIQSMSEGDLPTGVIDAGTIVLRQSGAAIATRGMTVRLHKGLSEDEARNFLDSQQFRVIRPLRFSPNLYEVIFLGRKEDALDASVRLHDEERVVYAVPALVEHIPQRMGPTDPEYHQQWQWNNSGIVGGTMSADVDAEAAWDQTLGAGTCVAVIDHGFDAGHEDLQAGVSDRSGYFDALDGRFHQSINNMPDVAHGTACAGMAAARHDNGAGGCGMAPEADLMLVACLPDEIGAQVTLARAIAYAADPKTEGVDDDGADVISCSLGPTRGAHWELMPVLDDAINFAKENGRDGLGTAIFWATSNGNADIVFDEVVSHPVVVAVGCSTSNDTHGNTAFGFDLEFLAPGVGVYTTSSTNTYGRWTGTSFATPCAAGVGALVLSVCPTLRWYELRQLLRDSCDKIGGARYEPTGHNVHYGFGRISASRAVILARRCRSSSTECRRTRPSKTKHPYREGTMSTKGAYLSDFFWHFGRKKRGRRIREDIEEANILSASQKVLVQALFAGTEVSLVLRENCNCRGRDDPKEPPKPRKFGKSKPSESTNASDFLAQWAADNELRLDEEFWDFQDATGRCLSMTQRWLITAFFTGRHVCMSMSAGPGCCEGDRGDPYSARGEPGGGHGEPGGGRGEPGGGRGEPGGGRGEPGGGRGEPGGGRGYACP